MTFVIPMMFLACIEWAPPLDVVNGFRFEQCVTMTINDNRHVSIDNVEWLMPPFHYAILAHNNSLVDTGSGFIGSSK